MLRNISKTKFDTIVITLIVVLSYLLSRQFDVLEKIVIFSSTYEKYEIDEIVASSIVLVICLLWFSSKRMNETVEAMNLLEENGRSMPASATIQNQA